MPGRRRGQGRRLQGWPSVEVVVEWAGAGVVAGQGKGRRQGGGRRWRWWPVRDRGGDGMGGSVAGEGGRWWAAIAGVVVRGTGGGGGDGGPG
ncbi:hypothetical protein Tco_0521531, partial [Tanacetum coccineum]